MNFNFRKRRVFRLVMKAERLMRKCFTPEEIKDFRKYLDVFIDKKGKE